MFKQPFSRFSIFFIFLLITYRVFLDIFYHYIVAPVYPEYKVNIIDLIRLFESYVLTLVIIPFLRIDFRKPSEFYIFILLTIVFLPMCSIYSFTGANRLYMYTVFLSILLLISITRLPRVAVVPLKEGRILSIVLCVVGVTLALAWLLSQGAANYFNLNVKEIYKFRSAVGTHIYIGLWSYLIHWSAKVFNPALIGWCLYRRKFSLAVVFVCVQVGLFGLTSHKIYIAIGIGVLILYILSFTQRPGLVILTCLVGMLIFVGAFHFIFNDVWSVSLLVQRPLFKPALLNFTYQEFFESRELVMLSNGIFGKFVKYPFDVAPPYLVGEYLKGDPAPSSNTGFLGTGYMHFGLLGVFGFSMVVGIVFRIVDSVAEGHCPVWFACAIVLGPFMSLITSGDLLPSLNTHGGLWGIFLLWLFGSYYNYAWRKKLSGVEVVGSVGGGMHSA